MMYGPINIRFREKGVYEAQPYVSMWYLAI